jgi:hypothetical protein
MQNYQKMKSPIMRNCVKVNINKIVMIALVFSLTGSQLSGCTYINSEFRSKADLGMFGGCISGAAVGWIISGNPTGGGLGCILGTVVGRFIGEFIDKKVGTREEALLKYRLRDGEEKLIIEESFVIPRFAASASTFNTSVRYTILAPPGIEKIRITETRMLFNHREGLTKLAERQIFRTQGTYMTAFHCRLSEKISKGDAVIITIISDDMQTQMTTSPLKIV